MLLQRIVQLIKSERKLKKMTNKGHRIGSRGIHKGRKENSKENGIWRKLSDEEYEREKVEIEVSLKVLMELL